MKKKETQENLEMPAKAPEEGGPAGQEFDYSAAMAQLEALSEKIGDPETSLGEVGDLVRRSKELIAECRKYLRSVRDEVEAVQNEDI